MEFTLGGKKKRGLILGISGQDGSYLAEFLLNKKYDVFGMVRRKTSGNENLRQIKDKLWLCEGNLHDANSMEQIISTVQPDEIYNLAAQSHVKASWSLPVETFDVDFGGVVRLLQILRHYPKVKFLHASSSEMFGNAPAPQNEDTPFNPRSPYAIAKTAAHFSVKNYRESYGLFVCSSICFNHESPRRGLDFVTRKITNAAAQIYIGEQTQKLKLGNLEAKRDWGAAQEYCEVMWLMLQQPEPDDFVIATGETHTVQEFVETAFRLLDLDWREWVEVDSSLFRPAEVNLLCGDASKAKRILGWEPKIKFEELVNLMIKHDLERLLEGYSDAVKA